MRLCLIGHPVAHSLSPPMHRAAFASFSIDGSYELIDLEADRVPQFIRDLPRSTFSGCNVTLPYKQYVFAMIEKCSEEARLVGAVNCLRLDSSGELYAHNTDLGGFIKALAAAAKPRELYSDVLLLGAGGAARSCLIGLALSGCRRIFVASRRLEQAELLCAFAAAQLAGKSYPNACSFVPVSLESTIDLPYLGLVVNATSIGVKKEGVTPHWLPGIFEKLKPEGLFFDCVYRRDRLPTLMMEMSAARGLPAVDGLGMLLEQAVLAFEFWTGRRPSVELMKNALNSSF